VAVKEGSVGAFNPLPHLPTLDHECALCWWVVVISGVGVLCIPYKC
jgi:hypothetical protein